MNSISKMFSKWNLYVISSVFLPLLYGCGGGGAGSPSAGGLFGSSSPAMLATTSDVVSSTTTGIATVHNPEPGTLLLLSSGMLAMSFIRRRMSK